MRRRLAFTLIELLVVIAIIAVLIAILLPSLQKARVQARVMQCLSGARQAFIAVEMYCNDWKHYYPAGDGTTSPLWHVALVNNNYMKEVQQTSRGGCPDGPPGFYSFYEGGDYYTHPNLMPEDDSSPGFPAPARVSYGLNGVLQSGWSYTGLPPAYFQYYGRYRRISKPILKHQDQIGLIFCVAVPWNSYTRHLYPAVHNTCGLDPTPYFPNNPPGGRHARRGIPVVYCDGHGQLVSPKELHIYPWDPNYPLLWWNETYLWYSPPVGGGFMGY